MQAHLDLLAGDYERRGLSPADARAAARRAFGGVEQIKEQYRDRRSIPMIDTTLQDLRYAGRTLRKAPVFTAVAVLSIALGIGANTAIFTVLDQVILRLLPVKDARQLVLVSAAGEQYGDGRGDGSELSYPRFLDLRDHNDVFSGMCARADTQLQVSAGGRTERITAEQVSGTYFPTLGVEPRLGRLFGPDEDQLSGGHAVAVLSHAYWKARFAADPDILGKAIIVNTHPMTIVGVAQEGFDGVNLGNAAQIFVPLTMTDLSPTASALTDRRLRWLSVFARLRPGVTPARAQAGLQPFYASQLQMEVGEPGFAKASAQTRAAFLQGTVNVSPAGFGKSRLRNDLRRPLWTLMLIVACVLLISCANVANLLLARASVRQREMALRLALGATRFRIMRQLLIESLVLAVAGGLAGLAIAVWGSGALLQLFRDPSNVLTVSASPDLRILSFNLALSLVTGLLFGVMPARQATHPALAPTLKNEAGSVIGGGQGRLRKMLVAAQVALSLLLLIGAGLFIRSLHNLLTTDAGINTARLITFNVAPGLNGYQDERASQFRDTLLERIRATPGVAAAAVGSYPLLAGGSWNNSMTVEGFTTGTGRAPFAMENAVTPGYFATMGMQILAGRDFEPRDEQPALRARAWVFTVAIANQTFARRYLQGGALGRHIGFGSDPGAPTPYEIIGVVSDAKYTSLREETQPQFFFPFLGGAIADRLRPHRQRAGDDVRDAARAYQQIDPACRSMRWKPSRRGSIESLVTERLVGGLSTIFGLLATLLAMIGLVWRDGLQRRAAHARDRRAHGDGRADAAGGVAGVARCADAGGDRPDDRATGGVVREPLHRGAVVWRHPDRSGGDGRGRARLDGGGRPRRTHSSAARDARGPVDRVALRVVARSGGRCVVA